MGAFLNNRFINVNIYLQILKYSNKRFNFCSFVIIITSIYIWVIIRTHLIYIIRENIMRFKTGSRKLQI